MKKIFLLCIFGLLCDFALKTLSDDLIAHQQGQQKSIRIIKPRKDR